MRRFLVLSSVLSIVLAAMGTAAASAELPPCTGSYSQSTILSGQGTLESVIVGNGGKLYYSGAATDPVGDGQIANLYRVDKPGAAPVVVAQGPEGPGGLAWMGRHLLWGSGNSIANGSVGDLTPKSSLLKVNPVTGKKWAISSTMGMANGVVRSKDGVIYASNDIGKKLDRITKKGKKFTTTNGFASLDSANGLTISRNGKYLYAAQTFVVPSTIARIEIADPTNIETYFTSPEESNVFFDGLTRDSEGNMYVAVLARSEVWKINTKKQACVLASGLGNTSNVALSNAKKGFKAGNLYAVGFGGDVTQIKGATAATVPAG